MTRPRLPAIPVLPVTIDAGDFLVTDVAILAMPDGTFDVTLGGVPHETVETKADALAETAFLLDMTGEEINSALVRAHHLRSARDRLGVAS